MTIRPECVHYLNCLSSLFKVKLQIKHKATWQQESLINVALNQKHNAKKKGFANENKQNKHTSLRRR